MQLPMRRKPLRLVPHLPPAHAVRSLRLMLLIGLCHCEGAQITKRLVGAGPSCKAQDHERRLKLHEACESRSYLALLRGKVVVGGSGGFAPCILDAPERHVRAQQSHPAGDGDAIEPTMMAPTPTT